MYHFAIINIPEKISKTIKPACFYGENEDKLEGYSIPNVEHYPIQIFPVIPVSPGACTLKRVDLQNLREKLEQCQLIYNK